MKKLLATLGVAALVGLGTFSLAPDANAQAQNGRGVGLHRVGIGYYKTPPGRQDEWLALYKKWHRPIIEENVKSGATISSRLYAAGNHAPGQPWDFAIVTVSPAKAPAGLPSRTAVIRKLFPDQEAYVAGERQRWGLTINHWDEELIPLSWDQDPLSVYYPIDNPVEPK
jgi:hypothetical protein